MTDMTGWHPSWQAEIEKIKTQEKRILKRKWALGFRDRGLGHGDFAIVLARSNELVLECPNRRIAEYLVKIHNASIKRK